MLKIAYFFGPLGLFNYYKITYTLFFQQKITFNNQIFYFISIRLDRVPLSKPRNQVEKDFSDGVLAAEIVHHYFPELVDLKEYLPEQNIQERQSQWK